MSGFSFEPASRGLLVHRWIGVRTISYDGYGRAAGKPWKGGPAVNFLAKRFARGDAWTNTWGSIGVGATWFLLGVDQTGDGSMQAAAGVVVSLLDDWVTVGYGRTFARDRCFPFVGVHVPVRL